MRDGFVFYASWLEAIKNLPREIQGEVLTAIIEYGLYGETTETPKPITGAMLALVKPQIDVNNMRYENGKKGGRPSKTEQTELQEDKVEETVETETKPKPNNNQTETKPKPNNNQTETKPKPNNNQTETKPKPKDKYKEKENKKEILSKESTKKEPEKFIAAKAATLSRKEKFYETLIPFLEKYPKEMIREFFDYWSEMNKSCTKMRFEQQGTWELPLRLATWARNDRKYGDNRKPDKAEANSYAMQKLAERIEQREQGVSDEVQDPW